MDGPLGAFIGPSLGGVLMDEVGFEYATLFVFGSQIMVFVLTLGFMIHRYKRGTGNKGIFSHFFCSGGKSLIILEMCSWMFSLRKLK